MRMHQCIQASKEKGKDKAAIVSRCVFGYVKDKHEDRVLEKACHKELQCELSLIITVFSIQEARDLYICCINKLK